MLFFSQVPFMNFSMNGQVARGYAAIIAPWPTAHKTLIVSMYSHMYRQICLRFE